VKGLHFIEDDLEDELASFELEDPYTAWLWPEVNYTLMWEVPN
jgi:hypothetical protein